MKSTGALLKNRRESLKISIAEVSIATKITPRMLQAIESGNMELLPARTFLRGFVKSYASYLKMDLDSVLKSFADEVAALDPVPMDINPTEETPKTHATSESASHPEPQNTKSTAPLIPEGISMTKKVSLGAGLVVLILVIVFVYKLVEKYEQEARVDQPPATITKIPAHDKKERIENPPEVPAKPVEATTTLTTNSATETAVKEPVVKAEAPAVENVKPAENKAPAVAKPTEPVPVSKPPPVTSAPTPTAASTAPPTTPPVETKPAPEVKTTSQEIIVEALDKVEVVFRVNGGAEKKVTLLPDQYHTIKATGTVTLEVSDGGAINVIHNGRDRGVPGDLGRPKKLQLP